MSPETYLAFVAASVVIIAMPGPNVALIVANTVAYGRRFGLVTVSGTSAAMVPQLALTVLGMSGLVSVAASVFEWVRWAGVAYLVWLAIQAFRAPAADLTRVEPQPRAARDIFTRGFLVSLSNPKTLLFFGAFLPQFVTPAAPVTPQLALLATTFLVLAAALDCCWALAAGRLRSLLSRGGRLRNAITGGFFLAAAVGLAMTRKAG